jgi:hypothetical protein
MWVIKEFVVNSEIGLFNSELIPLRFVGEEDGLGLRHIFGGTLLKEDALEVSRTKGLEPQGMEESGGDGRFAVKVEELLNLGQVAGNMKFGGHEAGEIVFGFRAEREE